MDSTSNDELITLLKKLQPHVQDPELSKRIQVILDREAARKKAFSNLICDIFNGKNNTLRLE